MPGELSPRHHLLPNVCTPRTAGGCVQHWAILVETLSQTVCNCVLLNVSRHVLLCTIEYVCTPPGQWGQRLQPDDCIFLETRAERTDLADCGRFPQISNFSGRRSQEAKYMSPWLCRGRTSPSSFQISDLLFFTLFTLSALVFILYKVKAYSNSIYCALEST